MAVTQSATFGAGCGQSETCFDGVRHRTRPSDDECCLTGSVRERKKNKRLFNGVTSNTTTSLSSANVSSGGVVDAGPAGGIRQGCREKFPNRSAEPLGKWLLLKVWHSPQAVVSRKRVLVWSGTVRARRTTGATSLVASLTARGKKIKNHLHTSSLKPSLCSACLLALLT